MKGLEHDQRQISMEREAVTLTTIRRGALLAFILASAVVFIAVFIYSV